MNVRLLPVALILFALAASAATTPAGRGAAPVAKPGAWKPAADAPKPVAPAPSPTMTLTGKPILSYVNGVPDTGQFLPDTAWLVRVNDRVTTVAGYLERYFGGDPTYRPRGDSLGRVQFLNSLIDRDVLGLSALATNRPLDFTDRADLREFEQRILSDILLQRFVWDSVRVTDAEVDTVARQVGMEGHFRHIQAADRATAERVRASLAGGKLTWHDAAKKYNRAANDKGPDGDRGWVEWGSFPVGVAAPLFKLNPGQIAPVIRTDAGYEIIQLLEKRQLKTTAFQTFRNIIQRQLIDARAAAYAEQIQGAIRQRLGMVHDSANVAHVSAKFQPTTSMGQDKGRPSMTINEDLPLFSPADTALVLTRWKGGQYTLGAFLTWYTGIPPMLRPNVNYPDGLTGQIESVLLEPYRAELARSRGLDTTAIFRRRMADKREQIMVEHVYQDSIGSRVWATRDERQAYYKAHMAQYATAPAADYAVILRHTRAGIDSVAKALRAGAKAGDILRADSLRGQVTGRFGHATGDEHGPYYKRLFEELRPGQVSVEGPDKEGTFLAIQLLAYDPGRQKTLEEAQGTIDETLVAIKSEERMQAMLARMRTHFTIASRPELVMQIRLAKPR